MESVILQPAGNKDAIRHYRDTIENPVPIERIRSFVGQDVYKRLVEYYPEGKALVWGVVPGKNDVNVRKWQRVSPGDFILFCADKKVLSSATVTFTTHNAPLAEHLWERDSKGQTWEWVYFLTNLQKQGLPVINLNRMVGYEENNVVQGFNVLDKEKSARIILGMNMDSSPYDQEATSEQQYEEAVRSLDNPELDTKRNVLARTEQTFLREKLFGTRQYGTCCICGEKLPVEFLVAAHIKKRAECSDEEKRDWQNIVAPMCKFGCDELYERGYVGVVDGKVTSFKHSNQSAMLNNYLDKIKGRPCDRWNEGTRGYFLWQARKNGH